MADLDTHLSTLASTQVNPYTVANSLLSGASPAITFGRNESTSRQLSFGVYGGVLIIDGERTRIANQVINALQPSVATTYVQAGRVSATTKGITGITLGSDTDIEATGHGMEVGDVVYLDATIGGTTYLRQRFAIVTAVADADNLTIDVVSTGWSAYTSGGNIAKVWDSEGSVKIGRASAWVRGLIPLYLLTTGSASVTDYEDYRPLEIRRIGNTPIVMDDGDYLLTGEEGDTRCAWVTSSEDLTAGRSVLLPTVAGVWVLSNATSGAQSLSFYSAADGDPVVLAAGNACLAYSDGAGLLYQITAAFAWD